MHENIAFGLRGQSDTERKRILAYCASMVGLTGFESAYPRELSGGMRQRARSLRFLDIIYMDEPVRCARTLSRA